jgi:hypothetical protein
MVESFSPIDAVELISSSGQVATSRLGPKRWFWIILMGTIFTVVVYLLVLKLNPKQPLKNNCP